MTDKGKQDLTSSSEKKKDEKEDNAFEPIIGSLDVLIRHINGIKNVLKQLGKDSKNFPDMKL